MGSLSSLSAAELLANQDFVRRLARQLANDEAEGDDLMQEAWVAALERPPARASGLRAWLARVLRNRAALGLRRRARRARREIACARPESQPDTVELVERVELHHRLVGAVLALPAAYREVVLCHYFRGETVAGMAHRLAAPEATVRTRLRRAREHLRDELRGSFGEHRAFPAALAALGSQGLGSSPLQLPSPLLELGRWTSDLIMKRSLLETPLIVSGVLGASLGFGGSLMLRGASGLDPREAELTLEPDPARAGLPGAAGTGQTETRVAADLEPRDPARRSTLPDVAAESPGANDRDELSTADARQLLASENRLDQVRAIQFLLDEGTPDANQLLLETFLASSDPLLAALLEEALLQSELNVAPSIMAAFRTTLDPAKAGRLADMLVSLAARHPALEAEVVELLVGALAESGPDGERAHGIPAALVRIGAGALDAVAAFLAGAQATSESAQSAAWVLTQMGSERADQVRESLRAAFAALFDAQGDLGLTDEERAAMVERTQTIAWAATYRPEDEHDRMGSMLVDCLFRAPDAQQCQSLAWGLANLRGLSDAGRLAAASRILATLPEQPDASLRQPYVWALSSLASFHDGPPDAIFFAILERAQESYSLHRNDPGVSVQLRWLLAELERRQ